MRRVALSSRFALDILCDKSSRQLGPNPSAASSSKATVYEAPVLHTIGAPFPWGSVYVARFAGGLGRLRPSCDAQRLLLRLRPSGSISTFSFRQLARCCGSVFDVKVVPNRQHPCAHVLVQPATVLSLLGLCMFSRSQFVLAFVSVVDCPYVIIFCCGGFLFNVAGWRTFLSMHVIFCCAGRSSEVFSMWLFLCTVSCSVPRLLFLIRDPNLFFMLRQSKCVNLNRKLVVSGTSPNSCVSLRVKTPQNGGSMARTVAHDLGY